MNLFMALETDQRDVRGIVGSAVADRDYMVQFVLGRILEPAPTPATLTAHFFEYLIPHPPVFAGVRASAPAEVLRMATARASDAIDRKRDKYPTADAAVLTSD